MLPTSSLGRPGALGTSYNIQDTPPQRVSILDLNRAKARDIK
jgi:hypothetical protein